MIRVKQNFGGSITKERRILPGDYTDDDPALFGIASYLLEHGFAVRIDEPLPVVATGEVNTYFIRVGDEQERSVEPLKPAEKPKTKRK